MANIEDLKEQLENLRIVNKEAYRETVKAIIEQRKLETQLKAGAIAAEEYKKKTEELNNSLSAEAKEMKALQEEIHKTTEAMKKLEEFTEAANKRLGQLTSAADAFTGLNTTMFTSFSSAAGGAASYARKIQGLNVDLRRSTGFADRHVKSFDSIRSSYSAVGLDAASAAQAVTSLSTGFSAFDGVTKTTRKSLLDTAADFKNLGVEFDDFASMNERLRFSFGLVGGAAQAASEDMKRISLETGRALPQVVKDFNEMGPELARFGSDGVRIFEELSKKARVLGTTVKEAFNVTELFDTFEGAANVAGRLNAQLGLQLNSVEMMKATSEERLDILRQEFSMRGIDVQSAGRRQQQMIASILGTDVETAKKMLGPEMDASRFRATESTEKQRVKLDDLAISTQEKLTEATANLLGGINALNDLQGNLLRTLNNNADTTAKVGLGTSALIAGASLVGGLALKGRGMAMLSKFRGAPKVPPATPRGAPRQRPTAGNRQQRRAREAIERRQGKRGSSARPSRVPGGATRGLLTGGAKAIGRAIPFLGMGIGIMGAIDKVGSGDYMGALGELGVGAMSFIPGLGGLAAAGLGSVALSRRDSNRASSQMMTQSATFQKDMRQNRADQLVIKELIVQSVVELDGKQMGETIRTYLNKNAKVVGGAMNDQLQPTSAN